MPPKLSFFHSTFHCFQVWLADESNSRVALLLSRTCFFFHKVWRADESTGFVAWAFAAGRLDILELNSSLAQRTGSTRVAKEAHDERSLTAPSSS